MNGELSERLNLALRLAQAAEAEILPRFQQCAARIKPDGTEVTDADLAAEEAIRKLLARESPDDAVLGEEFGGAVDADRLWVIDPIDGTQAFALGLPGFGALIGYAERGEPVLGVMAFPALGYMVYAANGLGCRMRSGEGEPVVLRGSSVAGLADAHVSGTSLISSSTLQADGLNLAEVVRRARRFRFVGDCVQHALVCAGRLDAGIDLIVAPWDVAAVIPCVREAGCVAADAHGETKNLLTANSLLSAGTPALISEIVSALHARPSDSLTAVIPDALKARSGIQGS